MSVTLMQTLLQPPSPAQVQRLLSPGQIRSNSTVNNGGEQTTTTEQKHAPPLLMSKRRNKKPEEEMQSKNKDLDRAREKTRIIEAASSDERALAVHACRGMLPSGWFIQHLPLRKPFLYNLVACSSCQRSVSISKAALPSGGESLSTQK